MRHAAPSPVAFIALSALASFACGYRAVYGEGGERFAVVLVRSLVPDAIASDEVVSGVRETLAREGALASGEGSPRVEVEVLREDEASDGIVVASSALGGSVTKTGAPSGPRARGTEVGVLARACLVRAKGGACERDTGDVRALDLAASDVGGGGASARVDAIHHDDALRSVARRVGARLALHVLGTPIAGDEGAGRER